MKAGKVRRVTRAKKARMRLTILLAIIIVTLFSLINIHKINDSTSVFKVAGANNEVRLTYKDGLAAVNWAYDGLKVITDKGTGVPIGFLDKNDNISEFNYKTSLKDISDDAKAADFNLGLSAISAYMSTGDEKFLKIAENTADLLSSVLPKNGIVPCYKFSIHKNIDNNVINTGAGGQATKLEYVSFLARINPKYIPLMNQLANGLMEYGINKRNNLAWFKINSEDGTPVKSQSYGYESGLGSQSVTCAEALLSAYETSPSNEKYKQKALDILKAIWKCRNKKTNLISEVYDVKANKVGLKLYPYKDFRYDDMGGVYIRGLSMAYLITKDSDIKNIALKYIPTLIDGVWDTTINGGAFRYLTTTNGESELNTIEIMHGLFIATLLNANEIFYNGANSNIIEKCSLNADHTIVDGFSLKNGMEPHQVNKYGECQNKSSDSQLGYAVIQYPYGYEKLSQVTGNDKYRQADNGIFKTLLERHKKGNNKTSPQGFINIVETSPPYGFEESYSSPVLMFEEMYIPSYLLYNSIHQSKNVKIDWYNGYGPNVFSLVSDMPFWDINNVSFKNDELVLSKVTGKGSLDLSDMGFSIKYVKKDNAQYKNYKDNKIYTESGTHKYVIGFKK